MRAVAEKVRVLAPFDSAGRYLDSFFANHRIERKGPARVTLAVGGITRAVEVTTEPLCRPGVRVPGLRIHWKSMHAGAYPIFDGDLVAFSDDDGRAFWLVLSGGYEPPGGVSGKLFDEIVGQKIADASVQAFLNNVRLAVERHFAAETRAEAAVGA